MYSNASGSATLKLFDMSMVEMASYEIQVQVNIDYVNPHPWPMEGGDRKHSSTSIFTGPTAGPEVIWSSREFGDWDGENISTKDIQTPITIDSSNRLYFSSKVKPITERCHNGYQYATLAVDGDSGELIAVIPYKGDGSSIAIDPDGSCWFAFESDTGAEFWRADVSGNTFVEACGIDMHDAVEGGPVINMHGSDPVAFIGSSGDRCSGYMFGMTGTGANVWNAGLAYVEHGVYSTPAVGDNGIVYFGDTSGGHGNGNVYGFRYNLADPGMDPHLYKSSVIGGVGVGPTIDAQGRVYVIDDDEKLYRFSPDLAEMEILNTDARDRWGPVVSTSGILYFETGNGLCAYDVSGDGDPVGMWVFDYSRCSGEGEYAHAAPLIDAWGNAYIGTKNKWVFGIDQNGGEMWSIRVNGSITGTPALGANGWLYIGDDKGYVYAIG